MSLPYNFVFGLVFSTILFIGSTALPTAHHNIDGIEFDIALNEELIIAASPGYRANIYYCKIVNPATNECEPDIMESLADLGVAFTGWYENPKWINKMNVIVLNPLVSNNFLFDVLTFGFPCYSTYYENMTHFKVAIFVGDVIGENNFIGFSAIFEDVNDQCKEHRPTAWHGPGPDDFLR
uniref:Uncharacterized protein n=1 Tax=Panagrolaimus superbus TaxID=310955 RepID=A0A914XT69_9BILA